MQSATLIPPATGRPQICCPLTNALYVYVISEILEDETPNDYDTNATLKAKTLYKSCIDTGKNCSQFVFYRLRHSHSSKVKVSEISCR